MLVLSAIYMKIFPAIDLKAGRVVRLEQGKADRETVYSEDPAEQARKWLHAGAGWVHVVDLDGAFTGLPANRKAVAAIAESGLKIQLGGGMRTAEAVQSALDLGVTRIVVGTRAAIDPDFLKTLIRQFGPEQVAVGIDANDGKVAVKGWVDVLDISASDLAAKAKACGVNYIIYTDISRDGMLSGPNLEAQAQMARESGMQVIASGGVGSLDDVKALKELEGESAIHGVIIGKALYDGRVDLKAALAL